ncbi:MAG: preprotein translocase subunit SecG [Bacteroidia bacterium]|nr:preprotein translocase subunit SecG [Bacteroidia bacterium]
MSTLFVLFGTFAIIVAITMILAVVIQNSKGGGISSAFNAGGATKFLGARRSSEFIEKLTWYLAIGLAVLTFAANVSGNQNTSDNNGLRMGAAIENQIVTDPISLPDAPIDLPAEDAGEATDGDN